MGRAGFARGPHSSGPGVSLLRIQASYRNLPLKKWSRLFEKIWLFMALNIRANNAVYLP